MTNDCFDRHQLYVFDQKKFLSLSITTKMTLGSVYTEPDPFGTGTKLVQIRLVFTRDLVNRVRIGSAIHLVILDGSQTDLNISDPV